MPLIISSVAFKASSQKLGAGPLCPGYSRQHTAQTSGASLPEQEPLVGPRRCKACLAPRHPAMTVLVGSGNQLPSATSGAGLLNTTSMGQACSYLKSTARIEAAGQKFRGNNRCAGFKEQAWALTERVDLLAGLEEIESQGLGPAAGRGVGD